MDSNANEVWSAGTSGQLNTFSPYYIYKIGLAAGTYYMNIKPGFYVTSGSIKADYKFDFTKSAYWEKENNNTQANSTQLTLGKTYTGVLADSGYLSCTDYYKVKLTAGKKYRFTVGNYSMLKTQTTMLTDLDDSNGDYVPNVDTADSGTSRTWTFYAKKSDWYYFRFYNTTSMAGYEYTIKCEKVITAASSLTFTLNNTYGLEYTGKVQKPTVTVKDDNQTISSSNYTVSYLTDCKNAGTHKVKVAMKGDYTGTKTLTYKIDPADKWDHGLKVVLKNKNYTYTGKAIKPTISVVDKNGDKISSSNYTVKYEKDCDELGSHDIDVVLKNNYEGTLSTYYYVNAIPVSKCKITLSKTSFTYNGKVQKPTVTVKNANGTKLTSSSYSVSYSYGCKEAGTYNVTITMKGNYTGSKTLTYKINPASISKLKIKLDKTSFTYDGWSQYPSVTVKTASGTKLSNYFDYTVTYASGSKNVGTYKVTVKALDNYTGTKTLTFKINPAKTTVSKLTAGKKSLKVAITKKSEQVTGYEVQYSTSKSFKSYKTKKLTSYKKTSLTLSGLSAKKTYYVRVRTYKTVKGVKYYSGWSTIKSQKTK